MDHHYFFPLGKLTVFSQASDFNYCKVVRFLILFGRCAAVFLYSSWGILAFSHVCVMEAAVNETFH